MTNELFNSETQDNDVSTEVETLKARYVKEDGSIDIDGLLKAKAHADRHIKNIETEQSTLREDLKVRTSLEALIDKMNKNNVNSEQQINSNLNPSDNEVIDVEALVSKKLNAFEQERQEKQNISFVMSKLEQAWGNDFSQKAAAKARELGETQDALTDLAKSKPKVFLKLMLGDSQSDVFNPTPPRSQVRSSVSGNVGQKDWNYFQKLKKEDPNTYWSIPVQKEIHELEYQAATRGETFSPKK